MHLEPFSLRPGQSRREAYPLLQQQAAALWEGEDDGVANLANTASLLYFGCGFWWVGFYRVDVAARQLVLGPFHGPVACTRIPYGAGVCGTAWMRREHVRVPNVDAFPGHIACSSASRSEWVGCIFDGAEPDAPVVAVLDIDSAVPDDFDDEDVRALTQIVQLMSARWPKWRQVIPAGPPAGR